MSTTNVVITPITSPKTPLATVEEPMSTSIYINKELIDNREAMGYTDHLLLSISFLEEDYNKI